MQPRNSCPSRYLARPQGGSCFGFVGGCVHRWRTDRAEALHVARAYPRLLEHHLRLCGEAKHELDQQSFAQWAADLGRSPRKQGAAAEWRGVGWERGVCRLLGSRHGAPQSLLDPADLAATPTAPEMRPRMQVWR